MNTEYAVILVDSTSHALRIEKLLASRGIPNKLIPVPRHLSSDCGVCVRLLQKDIPLVQATLDEQKISVQSIERI